jgi:hypothetical protein
MPSATLVAHSCEMPTATRAPVAQKSSRPTTSAFAKQRTRAPEMNCRRARPWQAPARANPAQRLM